MNKRRPARKIIENGGEKISLNHLTTEYLLSCRAASLSEGTIRFYRAHIDCFMRFCKKDGIEYVEDLGPQEVYRFLAWLTETGHSDGGKHGLFRTLRAMLNWYKKTFEPEDFHNPIKLIRPPKNPKLVLEPVPLEDIQKMIDACPVGTEHGDRDRALLLALLDTGARANEMVAVNVEDLDLVTGSIIIRFGKGQKQRTVFIGQRTKKAIRQYLRRHRPGAAPREPLFQTLYGERLGYDGYRAILHHRSTLAGVEEPALHGFRRSFAINSLRNGIDIYSLQKLMGHADIQVLRHYLSLTESDVQAAFLRSSPVDRM